MSFPAFRKVCGGEYYTRSADGKGKFFDQLTDAEVQASSSASSPLVFSLDDIVPARSTPHQWVLAGALLPAAGRFHNQPRV